MMPLLRCRKGMETPVSMMLLITASILAASVLSHHMPEEKGEDIYGIRQVQARSVAQTILHYRDPDGMMFKDMIEEDLHLISVDGRVVFLEGTSDGRTDVLAAIIASTPDDMIVSVRISSEENPAPGLSGERVAYSAALSEKLHLTVTISMHRGSMSYGGEDA